MGVFFMKGLFNDSGGELGFIAVLGKVCQINMPQMIGDQCAGDLCGGLITQVAMATHDTLFDAPRAPGVGLQ